MPPRTRPRTVPSDPTAKSAADLSDATGAEQPVWQSLTCHLRLWLVMLAVLAVDLASKWAVFRWLGEPAASGQGSEAESGGYTLIKGLLEFQPQYNTGAAMGILPGFRVLFVVVGVMALGVFLYMFAHSRRRQWVFHLAVSLVLAGAVGNIHDRAVFGKVRDFIHITAAIDADLLGSWPRTGIYPWVFNVADMALVFGVAITLLVWTRQHARRGGESEPGGDSPARTGAAARRRS